ncbi:MAG: substrate-binding domain-containing protein, partial [Acidimicrobiia bacterium]
MTIRSFRRAIAGAAMLIVVLASCETAKTKATSDTTKTSSASGDQGSSSSAASGDPIENSKKAIEVAYAGTTRPMPTTGPKAAAGKTVWVIDCSDSIESCKYPADAAVAAAKEIGWDVSLQDGGLATDKQGEKIRSAIAAGVDGIVMIGIDCVKVQSQLKEAKDAGIEVVYFYAYDCDDDDVPGGESLFSRYVNYGLTWEKYSDIAKAFGGVKGDYAIAKTNGKANVLNMTIDDYLVMKYINEGFNRQLAPCKGCKVVASVSGPQDEVINGGLKSKVSAALQAHPEIN